ncbi:MAG: glycogen/starch/alpha-glucan phosphorylase, partial [Angelakisella sp.]
MKKFEAIIDETLLGEFGKTPETATVKELYIAISQAACLLLQENRKPDSGRRASYFSAEFLMGRLFYSNLMNMALLDDCNAYLASHGVSASVFEDISDTALGNGGLGRLAACFLDSAAT